MTHVFIVDNQNQMSVKNEEKKIIKGQNCIGEEEKSEKKNLCKLTA